MQALKFLVVAMGVLIVAGVVTLGVLITKRVASPVGPAVAAVLDEPAGTHIVAIAATPDRTVLQLQGGGPDRIVAVDPRSGHILSRLSLSH